MDTFRFVVSIHLFLILAGWTELGLATKIHEVQGSGTASPIPGNTVTVQAVVVGDFQGSSQLNGFFIQEEDGDIDSDPLSSEGLFIYDGGSVVDVSVGDEVAVTGNPEYDHVIHIQNNKAEPCHISGIVMRGVSNDG